MKELVVRVDPILCDGHGLCAELLPERIELDEWGYPIVDATAVPRSLEPVARRAVAACPVLALRLEGASQEPVASRTSGARRARR
jgi:ferredoxin